MGRTAMGECSEKWGGGALLPPNNLGLSGSQPGSLAERAPVDTLPRVCAVRSLPRVPTHPASRSLGDPGPRVL